MNNSNRLPFLMGVDEEGEDTGAQDQMGKRSDYMIGASSDG